MARHLAVTAALTATVALSACGSSKKSASTSSKGSATPAAAQTTSKSSGPYSSSGGSSASTASGSGGAAVTVGSKHAKKLGTILAAGSKHLTVYLFEADHGTTPTCTGACEQVWPPVKASGQVGTAGAAMTADLGTTTRPDGTGDAYGQGIKSFGADWYALKPSGSRVDTS